MPATGESKVSEGFGPMAPGFVNVPYNDLAAVAAQIDDEAVAVLVEPIQGEGGVQVPDDSYLPGLRTLCDRHDMLLICDEVWTGCGRTGRFFAHQHWNVEPDVMTLGKGMGAGLPVAVMCAKPHVAELYDARKQGGVKHASTLGGNCLAMAVAAALFQTLERDDLVGRAQRLGATTMDRLRAMGQRCPAIKSVRGKGLFIGVELDLDGAWFSQVGQLVEKCLEAGLIVNGTQQTVLRLAPAIVVEEETLDEGLSVLERVLVSGGPA